MRSKVDVGPMWQIPWGWQRWGMNTHLSFSNTFLSKKPNHMPLREILGHFVERLDDWDKILFSSQHLLLNSP
jgi:hypothetical protein